MHWLGWIASGSVWVGVVGVPLALILDRADAAAATDVIAEPNTARVTVAWVSALIFAAPGIALIAVGLRRRPRRHDR